jgi:8-hydroxy-5-deazaflavin:NADPH oxidoreductase
MKVAILGTGSVAQTWAIRLAGLGHSVTLGTRNVETTLAKTDANGNATMQAFLEANIGVTLHTFLDASAHAEIIVNATKGDGSIEAVKAASISGKILLDVSNPLDFSGGGLPSLIPSLSNTNSLGEEIQKHFPDVKVVKTLNTMWCGLMVNPNMTAEGNHTAFICGNDAEAKTSVKHLMHEFGWKDENILDLGDITNARGTEGILPIWLRIWNATQNGAFNVKVTA